MTMQNQTQYVLFVMGRMQNHRPAPPERAETQQTIKSPSSHSSDVEEELKLLKSTERKTKTQDLEAVLHTSLKNS